jgi:2-amino-4-hydroxy-6-hydroxymethyldihydropteridine diphosphokinase
LTGIICYIGIGSNLGDALQNCKDAIESILRADQIEIIMNSSFYKTQPVGVESQSWFVNAVIEIKTTLSAHALFLFLQEIERAMGRKKETKNGPRIIDLDLLFYGQDIINEVDLTVPHPGIHMRRFVLEPLGEIASYFIHPVFGISVRGLKDRLEDQKVVELLEKVEKR